MSHLISGLELQGDLIFYSRPHKIIRPHMKKYLKSNTLQNLLTKTSQSKIVHQICERFSQIQSEKMNNTRELFISEKCQVLKRKFKSTFNTSANGKTVKNFFAEEDQPIEEKLHHKTPMNLKRMAENMPQKIQLEKKYNTNITIKMMSIQEARTISRQKQEYRSWLDRVNNSTNSPNFNKMIYLFQKLDQKERNQNDITYYNSKSDSISTPFLRQKLCRDLRLDHDLKLQSILQESNVRKFYSRKQKKPFTGLDRIHNRHASKQIEQCS